MIPNNNLSVLPWYTSIEQQNARKWWVYGRVYPLFTPVGILLPFQIMREHRLTYTKGSLISPYDYDSGYIMADGSWEQSGVSGSFVEEYRNIAQTDVYFDHIPRPVYPDAVSAAAFDASDNLLGTFLPEFSLDEHDDYTFTGGWHLPSGTTKILLQVETPAASFGDGEMYTVTNIEISPILNFAIYDKAGNLVDTLDPDDLGFVIEYKQSQNCDVIINGGEISAFDLPIGQYYAVMDDGTQTWYSEVFTVIDDSEPYLKIEWYDNADFVMDAGIIVYKYANNTQFKNVLYLQSDIAKPEYVFEEEGETRDGYFFPSKQISEKRYRFSFLASEYLLDVMRFIRMADFAEITYHGQKYNLDTFLITPEWEDNGDVAAVEAEFDTATVAKKIGLGYIRGENV